jgi:hypothetical protein
MLAKALRGVNRSLHDYRWFLYYLQREMTWNPKRREQIAALIGRCLPGGNVASPSEMSRAMADKLKRQGFTMADGLVKSHEVDDIREYLERQKFYDPRHPEMGGVSDPGKVPSTCYHGYYPDDVVVSAPHLMRIANDPLILDALELVFGSKPTITTALIWWLFSSYDFADKEREQFLWNTSNMHRDIDDWLQIKLFIYLTDVAEETAPHLFLEGSHSGGPGAGKSTLSLDFVGKTCSEKVIAVHGKAGVAWLENPFGFHLGKKPETGNRLIAAISYSLLPTPFTIGRTSALPEDSKTLDPYINRLWMAPNKDAQNNLAR